MDNWTNGFYLVREYACLALIVSLPITFFHLHKGWGLSWWWNVPVTMLAIVLVGGLQHRLSALAHEASHYMLFRHRALNELISDWFCLFPCTARPTASACSTWPIISSSTIPSATRTWRSCRSAATGSSSL